MPRLSVIIPALNESVYLPGLLDALNEQICPPDEVIVADAGSRDGTVELARERRARIVQGGMPAMGRNAGAKVAAGDLFQFFDADVMPGTDYIARAIDEFTSAGYAVATCLLGAPSTEPGDRVLIDATNLMLQIARPITPRAPGFCILARRDVHEVIGGFDESLKMSEDHDYVRRAAQYGEFGILTSVRIPVSMRRLDREGLPALALKYLWCELQALEGKPIRSTPFEYKMGSFEQAEPETGRHLIDVGELRRQLGSFDNPLKRLSRASVSQLKRFSELSSEEAKRTPVRLHLEPPDLDALESYLQQRQRSLRENHASLKHRWEQFTTSPRESIRLLEPSWLPPLQRKDTRPEKGRSDG